MHGSLRLDGSRGWSLHWRLGGSRGHGLWRGILDRRGRGLHWSLLYGDRRWLLDHLW